jgi:hypothetical protein
MLLLLQLLSAMLEAVLDIAYVAAKRVVDGLAVAATAALARGRGWLQLRLGCVLVPELQGHVERRTDRHVVVGE